MPDLEGVYEKILVPMKIGLIGEEVLGTALRLAEEQRCSVLAIHVIRVPMEKPFDAPMFDAEEQAEASLAEAKLLAADANVPIVVELVRARSIGSAIVEAASSQRRRPDRPRLGSPLAPPVPVLQPDRGLRPPQGPVRGDGHRLPAGRAGGSPGVS